MLEPAVERLANKTDNSVVPMVKTENLLQLVGTKANYIKIKICQIMPFPTHFRRSQLSVLIAASLLTLHPLKSTLAQTGQFSCRPDASGTGWVCESTGPVEIPLQGDGRYTGSGVIDTSGSSSVQEPLVPPTDSEPVVAIPLPQVRPSRELDWVPRQELTPEQLAALPLNCCGAFVEPARDGVDSDIAPEDAELQFSTVRGLTQLPDNTIQIDGVVMLQQGYRTVTNNESTTISGATDSILMRGDIEFREPGVLLVGDSAFVDSTASSAQIDNAQYVLHDYGVHGTAGRLTFNSTNNLVTIDNGEYSRCEPGSNFWQIRANNLVLDQERGRGYARGASLRIADVPVFYYPFTLTFPLRDERVSGFLAPSLGSTDDGGSDFELPYYFNLAPHYDATLSPRLVSDRGVLVGAETRYLASWAMNSLNLSHLASDKKYKLDMAGNPTLNSPLKEDRWFLGYEHIGGLGDNWSTFVDYNAVSDSDYFEDLGSRGLNLASRTHLNRQGRIDYRGGLFQAGLNVQRIQLLDPLYERLSTVENLNKPFDRLPQFEFSTDFSLLGNLRFGLRGEVTSFDRDLNESLLTLDQIESGALVNGNRINLEPELTLALRRPGWFFVPSAKYKQVSYDLENQALNTLDDPEVGVGVLSLDAGLIFERPISFLGAGSRQTLEPRLYYLNSDFEDQSGLPLFDTWENSFSFYQLFRDDRFNGGDRVGDSDQLTAAVSTRFLDPDGRERARISLGQVIYFDDRMVDLTNPLQPWSPRYSNTSSESAVVGEFVYGLSNSWQMAAEVQWNEETQEIIEGSFQFHYQSGNNLIMNVAYRYRDIFTLPAFLFNPDIDTRIKQTDFSTSLPLNDNWRILGRWNYDHSNSRNLESFAGVEFSNCCATVRVVAREWVRQEALFVPDIKTNRGVFFQFTLHGLGNIAGGGLSSLLSDSIIGFRDPSQQ